MTNQIKDIPAPQPVKHKPFPSQLGKRRHREEEDKLHFVALKYKDIKKIRYGMSNDISGHSVYSLSFHDGEQDFRLLFDEAAAKMIVDGWQKLMKK